MGFCVLFIGGRNKIQIPTARAMQMIRRCLTIGMIAAMLATCALLALCLRGGGGLDYFFYNLNGYEGRIVCSSHGIQLTYFGNRGNFHSLFSHTRLRQAIWTCVWYDWPAFRGISDIELPWWLILFGPLIFGIILAIAAKLVDLPRGSPLTSNGASAASTALPGTATLHYVSSDLMERPLSVLRVYRLFIFTLALLLCCAGPALLIFEWPLGVGITVRTDPFFGAALVSIGGMLLGICWLLRPNGARIENSEFAVSATP